MMTDAAAYASICGGAAVAFQEFRRQSGPRGVRGARRYLLVGDFDDRSGCERGGNGGAEG